MSGVFRNIDTPPPHRPASGYPPAVGAGGGHTRWVERGWGVNNSEDARHCSVRNGVCFDSYSRTHAKIRYNTSIFSVCFVLYFSLPFPLKFYFSIMLQSGPTQVKICGPSCEVPACFSHNGGIHSSPDQVWNLFPPGNQFTRGPFTKIRTKGQKPCTKQDILVRRFLRNCNKKIS